MLCRYIHKPSECGHVFGISYTMHAATVHEALNNGNFPLIVSLNTAAVTLCAVWYRQSMR